MAKAFINDENLTDIADAIRETLDESRQYLPSEMAAAIGSIPVIAQLNRKKYFQSVPTGAASGYATIERIEGNTVKFNQLVRNGNFSNGTTNWTWNANRIGSVSVTENIVTFKNITQSNWVCNLNNTYNLVVGHKYLFKGALKCDTANVLGTIADSQYMSQSHKTISTSDWTAFNYIVTSISNFTGTLAVGFTQSIPSTGITMMAKEIQVIDLTLIFGAGNEPSTVADFEAWLAQNIGTLPYYDYNAGELLSVKMSGMQTEDSSQQTIDTIAIDVTTITGINTSTNVREVMFADGMKQADYAGTVKDTLDLRSDTATVNVGSRAYQSGDESDPDVLTDGTITYYALTTPIEYTDLQDANGNPLNPRYKVEQGGTEQVLPVNTSTPTTVAPTLSTIYKKNV